MEEAVTFRDREKRRLIPLKPRLFSEGARRNGMYRGARREFCLHEDFGAENLEVGIRDAAIAYFKDREIGWHDGKGKGPSNHLCCSQSCCVNFWFPFVQAPDQLGAVLRGLGYDVDKMLNVDVDCTLQDGTYPYVAFEWIGKRNYLNELLRGKKAPDDSRTRGANFTSLDFCMRFRRSDGQIQVVAGEWKYTEHYAKGADLRFSRSKTDRLDRIYRQHLVKPDCQVMGDVPQEALFFDPFDQLMRQQLLCTAMEREREMDADVVSLLHVAPKANRELMGRVTSKELESVGSDIHAVWGALTLPDRFKGVATEDLLPLVCANAPTSRTREYLELRYRGMA
ncbi:MAG: hypothetical protein F4171_00950 [Gammaproteobacteria bacterium]|nr:hypothetical protein [Gammaproteobacteria bacterium]MYG11352.1 hypothetical protein [Gammaproteobacteria bacterium]